MVSGARYQGPVKKAISRLKYRWVWDIGEVICDLISTNLWRFNFPQNVVLVPIPLHKKRKNWRGFNQAELISSLLAKKFGVRVVGLLERVVETKTQVGLTKEQRKENIKGAFAVKNKIPGSTLVLVDDVYTTGATMQEACKVLKKAGAKEVWGMVVAVG